MRKPVGSLLLSIYGLSLKNGRMNYSFATNVWSPPRPRVLQNVCDASIKAGCRHVFGVPVVMGLTGRLRWILSNQIFIE